VSEDDLLRAVLELARLLGVMTAHFRPAQVRDKDGKTRWVTAVQGDGKGYPDLTLAGPGGVLFRELKSAKGACSAEQSVWLSTLMGAGADAEVWRPADLKSGRIKRELQEIAGRSPATSRKPAWMK
jgi:hypothetical protein